MLKNGELYRPPTPNPDAARKAQERATKRHLRELEKTRIHGHARNFNINGLGPDRGRTLS
jgi:hypothetical protein